MHSAFVVLLSGSSEDIVFFLHGFCLPLALAHLLAHSVPFLYGASFPAVLGVSRMCAGLFFFFFF